MKGYMVEVSPNSFVPFNDLVAQYEQIRLEIDATIQRVINSSTFIGGEEVVAFEKEFSEFCGAAGCAGVANGTDAIELALTALELGPGDEIILPAMTFFATIEPVLAVGATPVIVDIDPVTYTISATEVEAVISSRTRCILTVHLYGLMSDMTALRRIADSHHLHLIEDAAQSHGARYFGQRAGSLGDIATFSFYPGKNLGAYGDAGAVVSKDSNLIEKIRSLRNHGRNSGNKFTHNSVGRNSRLDNLQAAILRVKLRRLDAWNEARRAIAKRYLDELNNRFILPSVPAGYEHVFHIFCLSVPDRAGMVTWLKQHGIGFGIHYPIPVHEQPGLLKILPDRPISCPVAEELAKTCLSLPIYPEMTGSHVDAVIKTLQNIPRNKRIEQS